MKKFNNIDKNSNQTTLAQGGKKKKPDHQPLAISSELFLRQHPLITDSDLVFKFGPYVV